MLQEDHTETAVSRITLKCSGVKKLLPYSGFYPALRSVQLGSLLSQSLGPFIGGSSDTGSLYFNGDNATSWAPTYDYSAQRLNAMLQPLMAPGVFFNSIKAGSAVDYPVYKGDVTVEASDFFGELYTNHVQTVLTTGPNYRLPFESLVDFKNYLPVSSSDGNGKINFVETLGAYRGVRTNDSTASTFIPSSNEGFNDITPDVYFDWSGRYKPNFHMA